MIATCLDNRRLDQRAAARHLDVAEAREFGVKDLPQPRR
jgi:hypothetical protein